MLSSAKSSLEDWQPILFTNVRFYDLVVRGVLALSVNGVVERRSVSLFGLCCLGVHRVLLRVSKKARDDIGARAQNIAWVAVSRIRHKSAQADITK